MLLLAVLVLPLVGCDSSLFGGAEPPPAAAPAPPPKDLATELGDVRHLLLAGKAAKAAAAAEKLLAEHPEDDGVWDLVELTAIRAGIAGELVDRLSADTAIGGRVDRHQALRGVLAVEANRLGDALVAAKALRAVAPGDSAAIVALAVAKGAPVPEGLDAGEAALVAAHDPSVAMDPAADALPGWRAALVRADARLARGDRATAAVEAARADAGGVRARGLGALVRVRVATSGEEAWGVAEPAARAALEAGDAAGIAEILDATLPSALRDWKARPLAELAGELRTQLTTAKNADGAALVAAIEADAALRAGLPIRARDAATAALALPAQKARATWALALAAAELGNAADVETAAAGLSEPRATAAHDLARVMSGQPVTLPSAGLTGVDAAFEALLGAGWQEDPAPACAAAVAAAKTDAPDLTLWGQLGATRSPLSLPADASAGLVAEQAVRTWIAKGGTGLVTETAHPAAAGWNAVIGGVAAASTTPGVGAWSRGRAAIAAGDAAAIGREYGALAITTPAWRTGPWAPLLVLDGPLPSELGDDVARNAHGADPLPFAVALHGWSDRVEESRTLWRHGVAPLPPTATAEQRAVVWDAVAAERAGVLAWVAGRDTWPAAAVTALDEADHAAGLNRFAPPTLASLQHGLDGDAVISFRPLPGGATEVLYLGAERGRLAVLPASVARETGEMLTALHGGDPSVERGDRLRAAVIDPAVDVLIGIGRYVVVGSGAMGLFPVPALPEQADGVRFLADIRHVGYLPDLDALLPLQTVDPEGMFTLLALAADATEANAVRRVYPDAKVLEGAAATVAAYRDNAPRARFLEIGAFPASPDGGFQLPGGALTLADIATTPLAAHGALVAGTADPAVLAGRIGALRRAGLSDVLVESWAAQDRLREPILMHFWEGLNRRYSATRSLSEARALGIREVGDDVRTPGAWAGYLVSGRP
jgi:hypothetical protein